MRVTWNHANCDAALHTLGISMASCRQKTGDYIEEMEMEAAWMSESLLLKYLQEVGFPM